MRNVFFSSGKIVPKVKTLQGEGGGNKSQIRTENDPQGSEMDHNLETQETIEMRNMGNSFQN